MVRVLVESEGCTREVSGQPYLLLFSDGGRPVVLGEGDQDVLLGILFALAEKVGGAAVLNGKGAVRQGVTMMPVRPEDAVSANGSASFAYA